MVGNLNFKNKNLRNEPPEDSGGGGSLTRQGSVYSLTFDEFQSSLGKDFGSMNMDELLKNIWSAEETQAVAMASTSGMNPVIGSQECQGSLTLPRTLSQKTVDQVWKNLSKDGTNLSQAQAQRQQTLGEVTLEEFLVRAGVVREEAQIAANNKNGYFGGKYTGLARDFQQPSPRVVSGLMNNLDTETANQLQVQGSTLPLNVNGARPIYQEQQQQPSPRAVAGFMDNLDAETANQLQVQGSKLPLNVNGARSTYQQQKQQPIMPKQPGFSHGTQIGQLNSHGTRCGGLMGLGDQSLLNNMGLVQGGGAAAMGVGSVSPVTPLSSDGKGKSNGDSSSLSPSPYMFNGGVRGKKSGGTVEKVVERRQRRMIKNRESAARSRARKQAYTVELEAEVAKLKEENDELQRKQAKILEIQKNQEMEMMKLQGGPKKKLRRTESGPW